MQSLPGEIIEKISFILGDLEVFYLLLNTVPALIRRDRIHDKAIQMFTKTHIDENGVQYWYVIGNVRWNLDLCVLLNRKLSWRRFGRFHREGGRPAVIYNNRTNDREWWLNGKLIRENDFYWVNQIGWVEQDEKEFSSEDEEDEEPEFGDINWWVDLEK